MLHYLVLNSCHQPFRNEVTEIAACSPVFHAGHSSAS